MLLPDWAVLNAAIDWLAHGALNLSWWQIVLYTLVTTHITIAGVTLFLHRAQAHRALDLHGIPSHFFRFWLWLSTGMVTKEWVAIHRKHHAKCETPDDPHSPQTRGIDTVLWRGAELYRAEAKNQETMAKFGHGTPDDWVERNLYTRFSWQGVGLMLIINMALFGAAGAAVWAVQMLWIPITAAGIINGIGHYLGYRNYDCPDASVNVLPWGILIGGEELHNNHHAFGTSAKLSSKWYEFDIGWMYIRILQMLGLATVRKVALAPRLTAPRPHIDAATLQAVITHRYDLMQAYARGLRRTWREEIGRLTAAGASGSSHLAAMVSGRSLLNVVGQDGGRITEGQKLKLEDAFAASEKLRYLVEMRDELVATWERSHMTS
ncbi:fatty acid desaturase, partial [Ramlibacter sp.]|uniref:DesA family fatty acid desaturase n=1 Tax=Ramlibacter sp. TaxID=1917967 RepID=UPI0017C56AF9